MLLFSLIVCPKPAIKLDEELQGVLYAIFRKGLVRSAHSQWHQEEEHHYLLSGSSVAR